MRTELYINNLRVDIKAEVGVALNYAISDIKNPDKRNYSFSRSIEIAGSPAVNRLFGHLFEFTEIQNATSTNFNPDYNPNLKATGVVFCDLVEQFRGYVRLVKIRREGQDLGKITYVVELFGELGNIITNLGSALMTELDISAYNHTYNRTVQKASWTVNSGTGYYYGMIQYGDNDGVNWDVNHFYPAVYEKLYFQKIMEYAGYTYESPFIDGSLYNKFVIPFTGEQFLLSQSQVTNRLFSASRSTTLTALDSSTWGSIAEPVVFDTEASDPDGQYNPANGYFTCTSAGYYEFKTTGEYFWSAVGGNFGSVTSAYLNLFVYHQRGAVVTLVSSTAVVNNVLSLTAGNSSSSVAYTYTSPTVQCNSGDTVWIKIWPVFIGINNGWQYAQFNLKTNASFSNTVSNASIVEGSTVDMNAAIPRDIKMVDFLMSVVKDFNLFIEPDRTHPAKVYIDTADDFYGSGATRVWSKKMDVSKPVELAPMGALDARRYILRGTSGEDRFNKLYSETYNETYGMRKHDVSNDFLKNDNEYVSIFTPTPLVGRNSDDRVYPEIYTLDNAGIRKRVKSGIRRLYAGGAINTSQSWNYITASGVNTETTYPYCGHLNSISTPTLDLNYYSPKEIYYNATSYTDGNLWNRYHKRYIEEITDKNSKVLTAYFYLKPLDILRLSFRDLIFIDNQYFRLQRIYDYNPVTETSTKCDLLLIKAHSSHVALTYTISNYAQSANGVPSSRDDTYSVVYGNNSGAGDTNRMGSGNYGNAVFGSRNTIGNGADRNMIAGSSGAIIHPELVGSVVLNSDNAEVKNSYETWIGGKRIAGNNQVYTVTSSQTITSNGEYECTGTLTLTLDANVLNHNEIIQVWNLGTGTVTIAGGGLNIRSSGGVSAATYVSSSQYDSITLQYKTTYYIIR